VCSQALVYTLIRHLFIYLFIWTHLFAAKLISHTGSPGPDKRVNFLQVSQDVLEECGPPTKTMDEFQALLIRMITGNLRPSQGFNCITDTTEFRRTESRFQRWQDRNGNPCGHPYNRKGLEKGWTYSCVFPGFSFQVLYECCVAFLELSERWNGVKIVMISYGCSSFGFPTDSEWLCWE
jgi:hypothetical protein